MSADEPRFGWIGAPPDLPSWNSTRVDLAEPMDPEEADGDLACARLLARHAPAVLRSPDLHHVQLIPRSAVHRRHVRRLVTHLALAVVLLVGAGALLTGALRVNTTRYERMCGRLDDRIRLVQETGESIEARLSQLSAVAQARRTRDDLARTLASLHAAIGDDSVSFSEVTVRSTDAEIDLRGQSASLALPFELPQRLEHTPGLERVLLREAGQVEKGGGSVTEFRITARLTGRTQ